MDEFFTKYHCDRCGNSLEYGRTQSKLNTDVICMECKEKEIKDLKHLNEPIKDIKIGILENEKDYSIWRDSKDCPHKIAEMKTGYILNCMNMITRSFSPEIMEALKPTFGKRFIKEHGINYLIIFAEELLRRPIEHIKPEEVAEDDYMEGIYEQG